MNFPIAQCVFLAIALVFTSGCKLKQPAEDIDKKGVPTLAINPTILSNVQSGPHEIGKFDRERYFRIYQFPGCFGTEINKEFKALQKFQQCFLKVAFESKILTPHFLKNYTFYIRYYFFNKNLLCILGLKSI
jgi:hypothetical protein